MTKLWDMQEFVALEENTREKIKRLTWENEDLKRKLEYLRSKWTQEKTYLIIQIKDLEEKLK